MNDLIHWTDRYSVGVRVIDDQHKRLIGIINELHRAMAEGRGQAVIANTYAELCDYAVYHFNTEKDLMNRYGMFGEDLRKHRNEHHDFVKAAAQFRRRLEQGDRALVVVAMDFLWGWLNQHILGTDKVLGEFLNGKGVH